jgi:predicted nucleic acid-binding protein
MPPNDAFIVFLDTSVIFAAALSARGSARDLIHAASSRNARLIISSFVIREVERNLTAKALAALEAFHGFRALPIDIVEPRADLVRDIATIIEPKDAAIVAGAIASTATYLATYDRKHLRAQSELIQRRFGIVVATPDRIRAVLS